MGTRPGTAEPLTGFLGTRFLAFLPLYKPPECVLYRRSLSTEIRGLVHFLLAKELPKTVE